MKHVAPPLILIVDDDEEIRQMATQFLRDGGFDVQSAADGQQAIDALLGGLRPAAILLDLAMPVVDGWAVHEWLRGSRAFSRIPVVIWTSGLSQGVVGTARVLNKSSHPRLVIAALQAAMARPGVRP